MADVKMTTEVVSTEALSNMAAASKDSTNDRVLGLALGNFAVMADELRAQLPEDWSIDVAVEGDEFSLELFDPKETPQHASTGPLTSLGEHLRAAVVTATRVAALTKTEKQLRLKYLSPTCESDRVINMNMFGRDEIIAWIMEGLKADVVAGLDSMQLDPGWRYRIELSFENAIDEEVRGQ